MSPNLKLRWSQWNKANSDVSVLLFLLAAVVLVLSVLTKGAFLDEPNLEAFMSQLPELGLLSLAMLIPMITAGINLSIISSANLAGVIMALLLTKAIPADASGPVVLGSVVLIVLVGLLISVILGLFNGLLIAYIGIPAMLATLATMILYEGLTLAITKGFVVSGFPALFQQIGNGRLVGIPYSLIVFAAAAVVVSFVLRRRPFGKHVYMIGSNETATRYSSIDTKLVIVKTYLASGILTGLAAVIMASRFNSANARQGSSFLLLTVLIAVLGGTDPNGGFGKVGGLVLALVILQCVSSGLNLLGITSFVTISLWGLLLVGAIAYRFFLSGNRFSVNRKQVP